MFSANINSHPDFPTYMHIIRSIARKSPKNIVFSEEDLVQEMLEKLINSWTFIHNDADTTQQGRFALVKTICKNHVKDLIKYSMVRADMSQYSHESNDYSIQAFKICLENNGGDIGSNTNIDYAMYYAMNDNNKQNQISNASRFETPEESLEGKELLDLLMELRNSQKDSGVVEFLDTIITQEGRDRIELLSEEFERSHTKVDRSDYLTPFRRAKLLGKASSFPYRVMNIVRKFLMEKDIPLSREIVEA